VVISLPGVPREMKFLMTERVIPYLREHYGLSGHIIKARVLKTAGVGESLLDEMIGNDLLEAANPTVGLAAHSGQVDVRITAKADSGEQADQMIAHTEAVLRQRIGASIYGTDDDTIEEAFIKALVANTARVAISETGIASPISGRLQAAPGGQGVVAAVETYATPDDLRANFPASEEMTLRQLAERAAEAIAKSAGTTVAIAVVSRPEMNEDQTDAKEGSAIAVYTPEQTRSRAYGFGGQSDTAQQWTATWAMSMGWRMLTETTNAG
jgi:nicotinamide-nucleotide amidase